jgi:hypothetical protein
MLNRTILYYPTMSIPNDDWLRQALLYFDQIASIIPRGATDEEQNELLALLTPDMRYLKDEGVFKPVSPDSLWEEQNWAVANTMIEEFRIRRLLIPDEEKRQFVKVHRGKLTGTIFDLLAQQGVVKIDVPINKWPEAKWYYVEERTALLYMSVLAKYLADKDINAVVPGTDRHDYERLAYGSSEATALPVTQIHLRKILPVPGPTATVREILTFKRKHETELLQYRASVNRLQQDISRATHQEEIRETLVQYDEYQRREVAALAEALEGHGLATIFGSVKSFIKTSSPAFWGPAAVAVGFATAVHAIPVTFTIGALTAVGAIDVSAYLVDRHSEKRATLRDSAFSYIYEATKAGIL